MNSEELGKLLRVSKIVAILLIIFLAILSFKAFKEISYVGVGKYPSKTISVRGVGEVIATADVAQFTFSVTEEEDSISTAQETVTTKINQGIESLKKMGIEERDIKTVGYNAYPRYSYPQVACVGGICPPRDRILSGYEVSQTISVKVRDTQKAGEALKAVADSGISNISGLEFVIDDQDALLAEARSKAIEDAQKKIDKLAKELGVKIKGVASFSEVSGEPRYQMMYSEAVGFGGDGPVPSIPQGENEVTVQVNISYEIK